MKNKLIIFAGAGLSAESGLSTFRDTGGLWEKYDINEVCNLITFRQSKNDSVQRARIFNFYNMLKDEVYKAKPNLAHQQIAKWQEQFGTARVKIITTNIDNLLEVSSCLEVLHVHGEMDYMNCVACAHKWWIGNAKYNHETRCPKCNSRLTKPSVIFFNERAPMYQNMNAILSHSQRTNDDLILVIGSSLQVIQAPTILKSQNGKSFGYSMIANKDPCWQDEMFDNVNHGLATEILPKLDILIQNKML